MPVASRTAARDLLLAIAQAVADAVTPLPLPLVFDDARIDKPRTATPWARVTIKHSSGNTVTLAGAFGTSRRRRLGVLGIQIFTTAGDGLVTSDSLADLFLAAYEGSISLDQVTIRAATANEVDHDGPMQQTNVVINFEYDQIVVKQ